MKTTSLRCVLLALLVTPAAPAQTQVQIGQITQLQGAMPNELRGLGLVRARLARGGRLLGPQRRRCAGASEQQRRESEPRGDALKTHG